MNPKSEILNSKIKVLLIEDSPLDAAVIEMMLKNVADVSFHIACVNNLSAGLARLAADSIDMILLDLSLPDSDGFETFARVHTQVPHMPIVIITGHDDEKLAIKALQDGAQD